MTERGDERGSSPLCFGAPAWANSSIRALAPRSPRQADLGRGPQPSTCPRFRSGPHKNLPEVAARSEWRKLSRLTYDVRRSCRVPREGLGDTRSRSLRDLASMRPARSSVASGAPRRYVFLFLKACNGCYKLSRRQRYRAPGVFPTSAMCAIGPHVIASSLAQPRAEA